MGIAVGTEYQSANFGSAIRFKKGLLLWEVQWAEAKRSNYTSRIKIPFRSTALCYNQFCTFVRNACQDSN